jgi:hypothetical protein
MRISVLVFAACVLAYSITMEGTPIYELVSSAYQVPLVGPSCRWCSACTGSAPPPRAHCCAVALGIGVWLLFMVTPMLTRPFRSSWLAAGCGGRHGGGSLAPQWCDHRATTTAQRLSRPAQGLMGMGCL